MHTLHERLTSLATRFPRLPSGAVLALLCLFGLLLQGCAQTPGPEHFNSPDAAVTALTTALRADDMSKLQKILGPDGADILSSGDPVADQHGRQKFLALYDEKHSYANPSPDYKTLVIGNTDWPFPLPIIRESKGWYFDSNAGKEEILNRRIGDNELSTIQVCRAIADAQRDYALLDPDNNGIHEYAQQFASDPGKRNGLYWPAVEGEKPSPLGELAAQAAAEGYHRKDQGPTPFHGYYFRILKAQGPHAPNGALDYVVDGKMILGFALVAYPADYGNSGIMTFITGPDGTVYQKDLGEDTAKAAQDLKTFDPDSTWKIAD